MNLIFVDSDVISTNPVAVRDFLRSSGSRAVVLYRNDLQLAETHRTFCDMGIADCLEGYAHNSIGDRNEAAQEWLRENPKTVNRFAVFSKVESPGVIPYVRVTGRIEDSLTRLLEALCGGVVHDRIRRTGEVWAS